MNPTHPHGETLDFFGYTDQRLALISDLPPNWDGEGAQPVSQLAIEAMHGALREVGEGDTVFSYLSPSGSGVMAEWHAGGEQVCIETDGKGNVGVQAITGEGDIVLDGPLEAHKDEVRARLAALTRRVIAADPAWRASFF